LRIHQVPLAEFGEKDERQENRLDPRDDPRNQAFDDETLKKVSFEVLGNFILAQKQNQS
jgi:hypothetical protein